MFCLRPALIWIVLLAGVSSLTGQTVATVRSDPASAPGKPVSPWSFSSSLRTSAGWRDNVTVSALHPLSRAFWRGEADFFVLRPLGAKADLIGFVSGDVLRYFAPPPGVPGEQQWAAELETRWHPASRLDLTLKGVGFLEETFIDPSQTEGAPQAPLWVRARGGYITLAPKLKLPAGFSLELPVQAKRISYRGYAGDNTEFRPGLRAEWTHSDHLTLGASWFESTRHYRELTQSTIGGRALRGRLLSLRRRETEAKATTHFDGGGKWTLAAAVGRAENRDRTYGFLDYDEKLARLEAGWQRGPWRSNVTVEAKRLDYLVQTVGTGITPSARLADVYEGSVRVERDLNRRWMLFAEGRTERNRSNVTDAVTGAPIFSYRTTTVLAGVQRTF